MAKPPRDRLAEVKELVTKIALSDARLMFATRKAFVFSEEELDAILATPIEMHPNPTYPLTVKGVTFRNQGEVRLARHALKPKKEWPAGMQASHERIAFFMREQLGDKEKVPTINVERMFVAIPAAAGPDAEPKVLRMRRNARGELSPVPDAVPVDAEFHEKACVK